MTTTTTTQTSNVISVSVALVAAMHTVEARLSELRTLFPALDDDKLREMAATIATASGVDVASMSEVPTTVAPSADEKVRTRPRQLMVVKPSGKEVHISDAILSVLGDNAMRVPDIAQEFERRGWKTNSHAGMKIQQSIYVTMNTKPELFQKNDDPNNRKNTTYQSVAAKSPTVSKGEGKAPTAEQMLKVIRRKFANKKFALRDVANALKVDTRTLSVGMQTLNKNNVVEKAGAEKINGTGPEVMFYQLVTEHVAVDEAPATAQQQQ